jgi:hypothetical protein
MLTRTVQRPDGSLHVTNNFSMHLKGYSLVSGDRYIGTIMSEFTQTVEPGIVNTNTFRAHLIGTGQAQDMNMRQIVHWVITPGGALVVNNYDSVVDCP